jgi:hypothetical protein
MAFTRSFLNATGLTEEQVKAVMEEHVSVTDALKADRDKYKAEADKLPGVQKELDDLKGGDDWKQKYEDEHKAFEDFKAKTAQDAEAAKVQAAYRKLLIEEKIGEKWLDRVMESTNFSGMKLDKDGNLADSDELKKALDKKWGDVKTTITTQGAVVETPPKTDNSGFESMNLADKMAFANQHPSDPSVVAWLNK